MNISSAANYIVGTLMDNCGAFDRSGGTILQPSSSK